MGDRMTMARAFEVGLCEPLAARAAASPLDPWLFFREGWDWRWRSFGAVASAVEAAVRNVERSGAAAGGIWALPPGLSQSSVTALLATATVGAGPMTSEAGGDRRPCDARWRVGPPLSLEPVPEGAWSGRPLDPEGESALRDGLLGWVPGGTTREIALFATGDDLSGFPGVVGWSLAVAGALLLEPETTHLARSLYWARPSVLVARPSDVDLLAEQLDELLAAGRPRSILRRLGRWHTVVIIGREELSVPTSSVLGRLDVAVRRLDSSGGEGHNGGRRSGDGERSDSAGPSTTPEEG